MINSNKASAVQAVPLYSGKINLGPGSYNINNLIHCEADATITLHFVEGDESYTMVAGDDRAYTGPITVVSGTVTVD